LGGYAADITRTFPVSGRFSTRQRELYELVLEAEIAAIHAVRPGVRMHEVDMAAREVFRRANVEDHYLHGIGHHLGLDVHDASPDLALRPGMIITIEPGLYLPHEKIGIRIEDDILVTETGCENLSVAIPKSADEMERMITRA
jgi:Xaa-Pro aminopeptidase